MQGETMVSLRPEFFGEKERPFIERGELSASLFRYDSGVAAVRVRNSRGEIVVLPFHGQQIWDARFEGRTLTMRSMFPEPRATRDYLGNYGAFLLHCGATAMGNPSREDTHPLHGELPNAPYADGLGRGGGRPPRGRTSRWAASTGTPSPSPATIRPTPASRCAPGKPSCRSPWRSATGRRRQWA